MKTERGPSPVEKGSPNGHKPNLKERAVHQLKEFLAMCIYLWVLLTLFVINQSVVLAREAHSYQAHFFAFINALILAKVAVRWAHLDELVELEFDQARGPAVIPVQPDTSLA